MNTKQDDNGFIMWWNWFGVTMKKPVKRFNFWVYFIVGIVLASGAGVWFPIFKPNANIPNILLALLTFFPAIAATSCIDILFEDSEKKFLRGFTVVSIALLFCLFLLSYNYSSKFIAAIACLYSLTLWWLANADNPKLTDVTLPLAPIGGDVRNEVEGNMGEIKG